MPNIKRHNSRKKNFPIERQNMTDVTNHDTKKYYKHESDFL